MTEEKQATKGHIAICQGCQQAYLRTNRNRRYCDDRCRARAEQERYWLRRVTRGGKVGQIIDGLNEANSQLQAEVYALQTEVQRLSRKLQQANELATNDLVSTPPVRITTVFRGL